MENSKQENMLADMVRPELPHKVENKKIERKK